jgi:hypothetical protein
VVGAGAGFRADERPRELRDQCREILARHLGLDQQLLAVIIYGVRGKFIPGEANSYRDNAHGLPFSSP